MQVDEIDNTPLAAANKYKLNQNVYLTDSLDNEIMIFLFGVDNLNKYTPTEVTQICHAFEQVKKLISRNYFIEKFLPDEKIMFTSNKIEGLINELQFIKPEDNITDKFFAHLFFILALAERNELYECEANLCKFLSYYFTQDFIINKLDLILERK